MKTYSIGRDLNCGIVINDSTDVVSRRHALLNVTSTGKMTIIDQSTNGTYVNGIRISQNVPVPVTRKDTISFAHVAKLDWSLIPKSNVYMRYVLLGVVALLVAIGAFFGIKAIMERQASPDETPVVATDTVDLNKVREEIRDSLRQAAIADSLRRDSIEKAKEEMKPVPVPVPDPDPDPKPDKPDEQEKPKPDVG